MTTSTHLKNFCKTPDARIAEIITALDGESILSACDISGSSYDDYASALIDRALPLVVTRAEAHDLIMGSLAVLSGDFTPRQQVIADHYGLADDGAGCWDQIAHPCGIGHAV